MKYLKATFKRPITTVVQIEDIESDNFLLITSVMNRAKQQCLSEMKKELHQRIELLSMEDFNSNWIDPRFKLVRKNKQTMEDRRQMKFKF